MLFIKYSRPYLDAVWVRVHSFWIVVQRMWCPPRKINPSSRRRRDPISRNWSGPETKNNYAGEDQ
jgi:hypothetical protein